MSVAQHEWRAQLAHLLRVHHDDLDTCHDGIEPVRDVCVQVLNGQVPIM